MPNWGTKLPRVVETRDGKKFRTLREAAVFASEQTPRNEWLSAAEKLLKAADTARSSDVFAAHAAFRNALFLDGLRLKL